MSCPRCHCRLATRSSVPGALVCADCGEPLPRRTHQSQRSDSQRLFQVQSVLILLGMAALVVGMTFADVGFSPEQAREPTGAVVHE